MGCDIHTYTEIMIDGKWTLVDQGDVSRSYALFGRMAGVRNSEHEPISPPKGLPDDLSFGTKHYADYWNGDGHTHSWFDKREIDMLKKWYDDSFDFWDEFGWALCNEGDENIRLVFWFDN